MSLRWRRWHRWSVYVGGAQLLVWIGTGLSFSWFDFAAVRGTKDRAPPPALDLARVTLTPAQALVRAQAGHTGALHALSLVVVNGAPAYQAHLGDEDVLVDAADGHRVQVDAATAGVIARAAHVAHPPVAATVAAVASDEVALPAWRVRLADDAATDVLVSGATGEVLAWRNQAYRRFDFLWSLHVLGYISRDHPSHPAMRVVTFLALLIALSGVVLVFVRRGRGRDRDHDRDRDRRPRRPESYRS